MLVFKLNLGGHQSINLDGQSMTINCEKIDIKAKFIYLSIIIVKKIRVKKKDNLVYNGNKNLFYNINIECLNFNFSVFGIRNE